MRGRAISGHLLTSLAVLFFTSCGPERPAEKEADAWPTNQEILAYLDGKTISEPAPSTPVKGSESGQKSFVLKKGEISSLEVKKSGVAVSGEPWSTPIHFIFNEGGRKYAVDARVDHRKVDDKRAFFGLQAERIAEQ